MVDLQRKIVTLPGTDETLRITAIHPVWASLKLNEVEFEVDYSPLTDERLCRFVPAIRSAGYSSSTKIGVSDLDINDVLTLAPRAFINGRKTGLLIHYGLTIQHSTGCLLVADPPESQLISVARKLGIERSIVDLFSAIRREDKRFQSKRLVTNLLLVSSYY